MQPSVHFDIANYFHWSHLNSMTFYQSLRCCFNLWITKVIFWSYNHFFFTPHLLKQSIQVSKKLYFRCLILHFFFNFIPIVNTSWPYYYLVYLSKCPIVHNCLISSSFGLIVSLFPRLSSMITEQRRFLTGLLETSILGDTVPLTHTLDIELDVQKVLYPSSIR